MERNHITEWVKCVFAIKSERKNEKLKINCVETWMNKIVPKIESQKWDRFGPEKWSN